MYVSLKVHIHGKTTRSPTVSMDEVPSTKNERLRLMKKEVLLVTCSITAYKPVYTECDIVTEGYTNDDIRSNDNPLIPNGESITCDDEELEKDHLEEQGLWCCVGNVLLTREKAVYLAFVILVILCSLCRRFGVSVVKSLKGVQGSGNPDSNLRDTEHR